jgi:two-component system, NtrC family, response regulator HydG
VKNGSFRSDLFYRLNVFPLWMPPLRLRKEDIPALASHFLSQVEEKERRGFTVFEDGALETLARHDWPGNVRELKNAVHRAYVLSDPPTIPPDVVEAVLGAPQTAGRPPAATDANPESWPEVPVRVGEKLEAVERKLLLATLEAVDGDRRAAAEILGISLKTVYNRLKQYGLELQTPPGGPTRGS